MWHEPVTTTPPAAEPLELEAVKEFVRVDDDETAFDTEIEGWIAGVRADVEAITGTRLITQTIEVQASCFADLERLPIGPIEAVTGVTYLDVAGELQTLAGEAFELFGAGLQRGLRPPFGATWPAGAIRAGAITVTAVVGYGAAGTDLPQDLRVAMLRAVRGLFDDKPIELEPLLANHRIWL